MKKNGINKNTMRVAVCGVIAALCLALMMITGIIPFGTFAFPCFAGLLFTAVVIEYGTYWALGVYVSVSVLALFLSADKEAAVFFILIFGYYPILKNVFERKIKNRIVQYILKLIVFNIAVISAFFITTALLAIPAEEYTIMGMYVPWLFLIAGNLFFVLYDRAVSVFAFQYVQNLRGKIFKR